MNDYKYIIWWLIKDGKSYIHHPIYNLSQGHQPPIISDRVCAGQSHEAPALHVPVLPASYCPHQARLQHFDFPTISSGH